MQSGTRSALRIALGAIATVVVIAGIIAFFLLILAQMWPGSHGARIQINGEAIALQNIFASGALEFGLAWAAVTLAILVGVLAVLFALAVTSAALCLAATLTGLPLIVVGLIVWFMVRRSKRAVPMTASATPSSHA